MRIYRPVCAGRLLCTRCWGEHRRIRQDVKSDARSLVQKGHATIVQPFLHFREHRPVALLNLVQGSRSLLYLTGKAWASPRAPTGKSGRGRSQQCGPPELGLTPKDPVKRLQSPEIVATKPAEKHQLCGLCAPNRKLPFIPVKDRAFLRAADEICRRGLAQSSEQAQRTGGKPCVPRPCPTQELVVPERASSPFICLAAFPPIMQKSARPPKGTATVGNVSRGCQARVDALGFRVSLLPAPRPATPPHSHLGGGTAPRSAVEGRGGAASRPGVTEQAEEPCDWTHLGKTNRDN